MSIARTVADKVFPTPSKEFTDYRLDVRVFEESVKICPAMNVVEGRVQGANVYPDGSAIYMYRYTMDITRAVVVENWDQDQDCYWRLD